MSDITALSDAELNRRVAGLRPGGPLELRHRLQRFQLTGVLTANAELLDSEDVPLPATSTRRRNCCERWRHHYIGITATGA